MIRIDWMNLVHINPIISQPFNFVYEVLDFITKKSEFIIELSSILSSQSK